MSENETAKVVLEVTAGIVPGQSMGEYTKLYAITSSEWEQSTNPMLLLAERNGTAQGYAHSLMLKPDYVNWVRLDWIWL